MTLGWVDRAREELSQLSDRIGKLETFLTTAEFGELPNVEKRALTTQLKCMHGYQTALYGRLSRSFVP